MKNTKKQIPKIEEKFIKSFDKKEIYYKIGRTKTRKKPFIFFLHGLGLNNTCFKKEQAYFSGKGFSTINIDLRGHGKSHFIQSQSGELSLQTLAEDIYFVLKKEGIKKAVIAGHSFGGMVALKFCIMFPEMAEALILIDSSYKLSLVTVRPSFLLFDFLPCKLLTAIGAAGFRRSASHSSIDFTRDKYNLQLVYHSAFVSDRLTLKGCIHSMRHSEIGGELEKINAPVLVIETKKDEIFTRLSYHIMHKKIKNSELDVIKGHHAIPILDPKRVNREILKFVDKLKLGVKNQAARRYPNTKSRALHQAAFE